MNNGGYPSLGNGQNLGSLNAMNPFMGSSLPFMGMTQSNMPFQNSEYAPRLPQRPTETRYASPYARLLDAKRKRLMMAQQQRQGNYPW